jgi:DNA-binding response OmpR family regulator
MDNPVSLSYREWCRREVRVGLRTIHLTDQEHKLVVALLSHHPDEWIQSIDLMEPMWGWSLLPDSWHKVIHVTAHRARLKGVPIEGRLGCDGGLRIHRRGRVSVDDRVS